MQFNDSVVLRFCASLENPKDVNVVLLFCSLVRVFLCACVFLLRELVVEGEMVAGRVSM